MGIAMGAKEAIEESLKQLLKTNDYNRITVSDICRNAHLSRKSFYANFENRDAVVREIFNRESIQPLKHLTELVGYEQGQRLIPSFTKMMYQGILDSRDYYSQLLKSLGPDDVTFIRIISGAIYEFNIETFENAGINITDLSLSYVARFYATSHAALIQKWIREGFQVPIDDLAELYDAMAGEYLHNLQFKKA